MRMDNYTSDLCVATMLCGETITIEESDMSYTCLGMNNGGGISFVSAVVVGGVVAINMWLNF